MTTAQPSPDFAQRINRCGGDLLEAARRHAYAWLDAGYSEPEVRMEVAAQLRLFGGDPAKAHEAVCWVQWLRADNEPRRASPVPTKAVARALLVRHAP